MLDYLYHLLILEAGCFTFFGLFSNLDVELPCSWPLTLSNCFAAGAMIIRQNSGVEIGLGILLVINLMLVTTKVGVCLCCYWCANVFLLVC